MFLCLSWFRGAGEDLLIRQWWRLRWRQGSEANESQEARQRWGRCNNLLDRQRAVRCRTRRAKKQDFVTLASCDLKRTGNSCFRGIQIKSCTACVACKFAFQNASVTKPKALSYVMSAPVSKAQPSSHSPTFCSVLFRRVRDQARGRQKVMRKCPPRKPKNMSLATKRRRKMMTNNSFFFFF